MSSKQSIDRYQAIKYSNIVQPKLIHIPEQTQQSDTKLTGPRPHEINMDDMNAQSLKTNNHAIGYNEKDSRISFTDNQADKEIPKNDDNFQPNQDVVIDQVRSTNKLFTFNLIIKTRLENQKTSYDYV
jgi:hypothetical protein